MYKLLFAICIAVLAVVIARLGLEPLDKVALSLDFTGGTAYKVWIDADRELDLAATGRQPRKWDEHVFREFMLNPDPADTLFPGRFRSGTSGMSGNGPFRLAHSSRVDLTDTLAVRRYYLEQLPQLAAENVSSLLAPFYFDTGFCLLKQLTELVARPFYPPDSVTREGKHIPKAFRLGLPPMDPAYQARVVERTVDRIRKLYPGKPVSAGMSWRVVESNIEGYPVEQVTGVTVMEKKAGLVTLRLNSTAGTSGTPVRVDSNGVFMTIEFNATMDGTLVIKEATGLIDKGAFEQKVEGMFRVDSVQGLQPPEETPFVINSRFRVSIKETPGTRFLQSIKGAPGKPARPGKQQGL